MLLCICMRYCLNGETSLNKGFNFFGASIGYSFNHYDHKAGKYIIFLFILINLIIHKNHTLLFLNSHIHINVFVCKQTIESNLYFIT